jgi:hypothetical protein
MVGGWRRLHNEELHNLRWEGHVSRMGQIRNAHKFFVGKTEGKKPLEDLDVDVKITLEWILRKQGGKVWTRFIWLRIGTSGGLL